MFRNSKSALRQINKENELASSMASSSELLTQQETFQLFQIVKSDVEALKKGQQEIKESQRELSRQIYEMMQLIQTCMEQQQTQATDCYQNDSFGGRETKMKTALSSNQHVEQAGSLEQMLNQNLRQLLHSSPWQRLQLTDRTDEETNEKLSIVLKVIDGDQKVQMQKVRDSEFFLEAEIYEARENGEPSYSQRGYITEVCDTIGDQEIKKKLFIALTDESLKQQIETDLDIEDETQFLRMLEKLQHRVPIFQLENKTVSRIFIEINSDKHAQGPSQDMQQQRDPSHPDAKMESQVKQTKEVLSLGCAFYTYKQDEFMTCSVREELNTFKGKTKSMSGVFYDESSFVCIQTLDGVLLVIKTQEPKNKDEQENSNRKTAELQLKLSSLSDDEQLIDQINSSLSDCPEARLFLGVLQESQVPNPQSQIPQGAMMVLKLFKLDHIAEGEQLNQLLSK